MRPSRQSLLASSPSLECQGPGLARQAGARGGAWRRVAPTPWTSIKQSACASRELASGQRSRACVEAWNCGAWVPASSCGPGPSRTRPWPRLPGSGGTLSGPLSLVGTMGNDADPEYKSKRKYHFLPSAALFILVHKTSAAFLKSEEFVACRVHCVRVPSRRRVRAGGRGQPHVDAGSGLRPMALPCHGDARRCQQRDPFFMPLNK